MAGKTFKEIKGLPGFCCFLIFFFLNKINECGGEVGKAGGGGDRITWRRRGANQSCLSDLKGTQFGNEQYFFLIHNLGALLWFWQRKKEKALVNINSPLSQTPFHLFGNWKLFPTWSLELLQRCNYDFIGLHVLGVSVRTALSMVSALLLSQM